MKLLFIFGFCGLWVIFKIDRRFYCCWIHTTENDRMPNLLQGGELYHSV